MKETLLSAWLYFSFIRCPFHFLFYYTSKNKAIIDRDLDVWIRQLELPYSRTVAFVHLLVWHKEFRNLFYYRLKPWGHILNLIMPKLSSLYLNAKYIGPGFFIQHGENSRINGEYIGANCWVNQDVAIAFSNRTDRPTLQDGVKVHVGAKVLGKVTIGENSIIAANAVIVKNVPPNCTVVGVYPAYIVKENGIKVKKPL
ncbi:serine O-acetyltransferase [Cesiribacter andamanensis]|uniref:Serine acetyltransferase n=1 Tax=Cesiribacter andamanensis AMV16 TaxID=1279009 RepID=M7N5L0_9BACT|nr:serine acetyltransferase [Cesiribacter andamanensis]EMR02577.1 Serine acetyltransferase [Cesiribacter andamanensis AMV16]